MESHRHGQQSKLPSSQLFLRFRTQQLLQPDRRYPVLLTTRRMWSNWCNTSVRMQPSKPRSVCVCFLVFTGMNLPKSSEPQQSWPEFTPPSSSIWDIPSNDSLHHWPSSSSSPTAPTSVRARRYSLCSWSHGRVQTRYQHVSLVNAFKTHWGCLTCHCYTHTVSTHHWTSKPHIQEELLRSGETSPNSHSKFWIICAVL